MYYHTEEACTLMPEYLLENSNLLEAGCCSGKTMKTLIDAAELYSKPFHLAFGFDSFIGLPKETEGVWHNPEWPEGEYSALKYFNLQTVEDAVKFTRDTIGNRNNIHIMDGFFDTSLTSSLGKQLTQTAGFVNIDCDLHSSTVTFMDWLLRNRVMLSGCILRMDDWLGTQYNDYHLAGENLAMEEMTTKYNIVWDSIVDNVFIYKEHKVGN